MSSPTFEDLFQTRQSSGGHIVQPWSEGEHKAVLMSMKGPASYETGGVTLLIDDMELTWLLFMQVSISSDKLTLCHVVYSDASPLESVVLKFTDLAGTEIANTTDLSAKRFRVHAMGRY